MYAVQFEGSYRISGAAWKEFVLNISVNLLSTDIMFLCKYLRDKRLLPKVA